MLEKVHGARVEREDSSFGAALIAKLIDNLQFTLVDVYVRYEDSVNTVECTPALKKRVRDLIHTVAPQWSAFAVRASGNCPGFILGTRIKGTQWQPRADKLLRRTTEIYAAAFAPTIGCQVLRQQAVARAIVGYCAAKKATNKPANKPANKAANGKL